MSLNDILDGADDSIFEGAEPFEGELPPQMSDLRIAPPQPGRYKFTIPSIGEEVFSLVDTKEGKALKADFKDSNCLLINNHDGSVNQFRWSLVNAPRVFGKVKVPGGLMDYLVKALHAEFTVRTTAAYVQALLDSTGKFFYADLVYTAYCNPKKSMPVAESNDGAQTVGCGMSWRMKGHDKKDGTHVGTIPSENGKIKFSFPCECGALLRAWPELQRIGDK